METIKFRIDYHEGYGEGYGFDFQFLSTRWGIDDLWLGGEFMTYEEMLATIKEAEESTEYNYVFTGYTDAAKAAIAKIEGGQFA